MTIKGKLKVERRISNKSGKEYTAVFFENEHGEEMLVSFDARVIANVLMYGNEKGGDSK